MDAEMSTVLAGAGSAVVATYFLGRRATMDGMVVGTAGGVAGALIARALVGPLPFVGSVLAGVAGAVLFDNFLLL
jgi:hypothetical protein